MSKGAMQQAGCIMSENVVVLKTHLSLRTFPSFLDSVPLSLIPTEFNHL